MGKIIVASIGPDLDEPRWEYVNGKKDRIGEPQRAYAEGIFNSLKSHGYDVIADFGETYGKTLPCKDIEMALVMHGCRGLPEWKKRFEYIDALSDNVWCLMGSHLHAEYAIYDRMGYSGGNSYAIDPGKWGDIAKVNLDEANDLHNYLYSKYVEGSISKYAQPRGELKSEPFVLLLGQMSGDSSTFFSNFKGYISDHNHGNYQRTMWIALNELNKWGVKVLYKPHPKENGPWSWGVREIIKSGIWKNCSIIDGVGVHQLLGECLGAVTINSGSGFEALLHLKPVVTLGRVDYSIATRNCSTAEDIASTKDFILKPDPKHGDFIKKFLLAHHQQRASSSAGGLTVYRNAVDILESKLRSDT